MQAVVFSGGLGSRLGSLTRNIPKPMLPVGGKPFIEYIIEGLSRFGINDVILLVGYKGENFFPLTEPGYFPGCRVRLHFDGESLLGTGGALKNASNILDDFFFLLNGDTLFDINLFDLAFRMRQGYLVNIAFRNIDDISRYGHVLVEEGSVKNFSSERKSGKGTINGGIYYISKDILSHIPQGESSLERDVFPSLAKMGLVGGEVYNRPFIDIGIPADYAEAENFLNSTLKRTAVFFDRDGVLNHDDGYVYKIDDLRWIDGAIESIKYFNDLGFYVFVVTNQAGIAKGHFRLDDLMIFHKHFKEVLQSHGAHIDAFEFCPFHEDASIPEYRKSSYRRKPNPGMIDDLFSQWSINKDTSFLIGDKDIDIEAARRAGIKGHLFPGGNLFEFLKSEEIITA